MAGRIYSFQQRLEIQIMERWVDLALTGTGDTKTMREGFTTLQLIIDDDPEISPELKPKIYFQDQLVFSDRASVPSIILWITRLHRYIDSKASGRLPR